MEDGGIRAGAAEKFAVSTPMTLSYSDSELSDTPESVTEPDPPPFTPKPIETSPPALSVKKAVRLVGIRSRRSASTPV
jgi:hypothetical protein